MNNKQKMKQIVHQTEQIRLRCKTSCLQLENYLSFQHLKVTDNQYFIYPCGVCGKTKPVLPQSFGRAFKNMMPLQQAEFYLMNAQSIQKILNFPISDASVQNSKESSFKNGSQRGSISMIFKIKSSQTFKKWTQTSAQIFYKEKIIKLTRHKIEIDLHYYLLRRSKNKNLECFVLQSTSFGPLGDQIRIAFPGIGCQFEETFKIFNELWKQAQFEVIADFLHQDKSQCQDSTSSTVLSKPQSVMSEKRRSSNALDQIWKSWPMIDQLSKTDLLQLKLRRNKINKMYALEVLKTFGSFQRFTEKGFGQFYQKKNGLRIRKILQISSPSINSKNIKNLIENIQLTKKRKSTIDNIKVLADYKELQTEFIKQIHHFGQEDIQFIYERSSFVHFGATYILERSLNSVETSKNLSTILHPFIHHCLWRIRQKDEGSIQIFVQAKIDYKKQSVSSQSHKFTSLFIGELGIFLDKVSRTEKIIKSESFYQDDLSEITDMESEIFYTLPGSTKEYEDVEIQGKLDHFQQAFSDCSIDEQYSEAKRLIISNLLKYYHIQKPMKKSIEVLMKSLKGHCLWEDEWQVKQNGDLVNINFEKIKIQSSVLKLVLKNIGRNLFSGKSILSISLPIQIFGTDSNLQRLAKGFIYAPHFLEKAASFTNPVQKMKYIVCFGLGFSLSYIKMEKPFNPILGETYQGIIDGCPVYGQQISHHPPISSLMMFGRGYRVYGNFQAKVEMGMNSVSGINEGFNHIQFEDGSKFKINCPPGEMSGLVYGDRKLALAKKSFCIDQQNLLVCEICWGKNSSIGDQNCKLNDYCHGKIVRVKDRNVLTNLKAIKGKDIQEQLGTISGRFTQKLMFNQQIIFDVNQKVPFLMQDYSPCLESDCRNRKDIIQRKQNDFVMAQQAKQELQKLQRNDRKLRGGD